MIGLFFIYVFLEVIKRKLRCFGFYVFIDDLMLCVCLVIDIICGYSLDLLIDEVWYLEKYYIGLFWIEFF